jgi:hypothetical protein
MDSTAKPEAMRRRSQLKRLPQQLPHKPLQSVKECP